ncbi:MAG TPA: YlxM family DNA-binding protein [Patescibacteria group bacterium]|nr:YlxM family DNA-binding protein [Patescibacteria group bacterium]
MTKVVFPVGAVTAMNKENNMLDKVLRITQLLDFYSALLTEKQRQVLEMHYQDDWSLAEISDSFGVSRQAVHDILRRAEQVLEEYEIKLALVDRHERQKETLRQVHGLLSQLPASVQELTPFHQALGKLGQLLEDSPEV